MNNFYLFRMIVSYIKFLILYEKILNFINPIYIFYINENLKSSLIMYTYICYLKSRPSSFIENNVKALT
jgi:hypothetical protein